MWIIEEVGNSFTTLLAIIHAATETAANTPAKYSGDEERALRGCKTKMKVSGQFQTTESAGNYAVIRTYLETCTRNVVNEVDALKRLCLGVPYAVGDFFEVGCE